jgi:hypothetical protein
MAEQTSFESLPDRFDKFTERARRALTLAQAEAVRLNHNYIGTEHLLLGLLAEGTGLGTIVLTSMGLDPSQVRAAVERIVQPGHRQTDGEIGLTPRAKKVIDLAVEEARRLNHHYIGQEHLLIGLVREGESIAYGVLTAMGVTLERVRVTVTGVLASGARAGPAPATKSNVITCRITDEDVQALDDLVEAGVRSTRSDAAAWLIRAGIEANAHILHSVRDTVAEIRRLREQAQALAQRVSAPPAVTEAAEPASSAPGAQLSGQLDAGRGPDAPPAMEAPKEPNP